MEESPAPLDGRALVALAAVLLGAHLLLFPRLASLDAFYHLGHAAHFLEAGPLDTAFPWATQSVMGRVGADLWWGLHVVLMPFALLGDPAMGAIVAAVVFSAVLALTAVAVLRGLAVPGAGWWAVLLLVAVPNVLYRFVMVRPHVLSLAAGLLLVAALVRGRPRVAGAAAFAITWLHLSLFWMAPGLLIAWALAGGVERVVGRRPPMLLAGAVLAGSLLGWLLRPNPMGAAELAWIQIVELFAAKGTEAPIPFAVELRPLPPMELLRTSWLFLGAWLAAGGVTLARWRRVSAALTPDQRRFHLTCLLVSGAFLVLAVASARRAQVEWVVFGLPVVALAWTAAMARGGRTTDHDDRTADHDGGTTVPADAAATRRRVLRWGAAALLALHLPWAAWRHHVNTRAVAYPPDLLRGAAAFLHLEADPGDVVFHAKWDNFGPLFARNRSVRYLSGMDPIFFYRHDPARWWEFWFLSADATTEYTCDAFPCAEGTATGTHEALRDHFGARWVVVEPQRNPKLLEYLRGAPGFRLGVDTGRELVFEVLPEVPEAP